MQKPTDIKKKVKGSPTIWHNQNDQEYYSLRKNVPDLKSTH